MPGARPAVGWRRRVRAAATERLGLKAMALLLAIMLWAIVSLKDQAEDVVPARLVPILADGMALEGPTPRVRVLVRGLGRELLELHQTPPVIRWRLPLTAMDEVMLELLPSHVVLPPGVEAKVEEVMPRFVTLRVRRLGAPSPTPPADRAPGVVSRQEGEVDRPAPAAGDSLTAPRDSARVPRDSARGPRDSVAPAVPLPSPPDTLP